MGGICNHCSALVSSKDGTTNLHTHLRIIQTMNVKKKSSASKRKGRKLVSKFSVAPSPYQSPKSSPLQSTTPLSAKTQPTWHDSIKKQLSFQGKNLNITKKDFVL